MLLSGILYELLSKIKRDESSLKSRVPESTSQLIPNQGKFQTGANGRLGSITSRCSGKEPALLPRTLLGEGGPDTRERRKSSLMADQNGGKLEKIAFYPNRIFFAEVRWVIYRIR